MELKPGYKRTEVGVIPSDWGAPQIEKVIDEISMGPFGSDITVSNFVSSGVPVLNGFNVSQERLIEEFENFVTPEKARSLKKAVARRGEVVITHRGTIGQISYIPNDSEFERYVVSQSQFRVRFSHRVLPEWVVRYFHSDGGAKKLIEGKGHTGVPAIAQPTTTFRKLFVPLPSLPEQSAITAALGDVDALLSALDALIAKQRDLKTAAMQQLLTGKKRLPGFGGEWEMKRLDELASVDEDNLGATTSPGYAFKYVSLEDVDAGTLRRYSEQVFASSPSRARRKLRAGDVLVSTVRPNLKSHLLFDKDENDWICSTGFSVLRCAKGVAHPGFVFQHLFGNVINAQINALLAGSNYPAINGGDVRRLEVAMPSLEEQAAIAEVLGDMDAQLAALEQQREKIALLKQGMMQELLTGRMRLVQSIAQPASNVVPFPKPEANPAERKAPVAFVRSVFAAEIVERLHAEPTFGHVKFQKLIYLAEHMCKVDIGANYHRDAAGPYGNRALRSIDSQLKKSKWFEGKNLGPRYQYVPMDNRGGHKQYFDRYFADVSATFDKVIDTFRLFDTERCGIVATLYEAWRDLLAKNGEVTDDAIVDQALNHWHDDKKRISEDRWRKALGWMREKGFVPEGGD